MPLKGLGRFVHEAVAIDPATGIVYLTEDHYTAGFYRFVPTTPGALAEGGRLEMLAVDGRPRYDTRTGQRTGRTLPVHWVPIADPDRPHLDNRLGDAEGVSSQGRAQGAAIFARLEGAWFGGGSIFFDATSGGNMGTGRSGSTCRRPAASAGLRVARRALAEQARQPDGESPWRAGGL